MNTVNGIDVALLLVIIPMLAITAYLTGRN